MGLSQNILTQKVGDLPLRPLILLKDGQTARQVLQQMREREIGAAIAVDAQGKPVGVFNEKLLISLLVNNPAALDEPVVDYMTRNVACVSLNDSVATLIATMQQRMLRWVVVVDADGKAVNLTGLRGAMEFVVEHFPRRVLVQPLKSKLAIDEREGA